MALDARLLEKARQVHAQSKLTHELAQRELREKIYKEIPRTREISLALPQSVYQSVHVSLTNQTNPEEEIKQLEIQNLALQEEERQLLREAGYDENALSDPPLCLICHDRLHVGTGICACLLATYHRVEAREMSLMHHLRADRFETFSLDFYDKQLDTRFGVSAYDNMHFIFNHAQQFAHNFRKQTGNLFFLGSPGLGKTFLSTCIANTVADAGFSVAYETASALFQTYERVQFGRGEDMSADLEAIKRFEHCDLLILDDLGTELTTNFTISALYNLINTRILRKRNTIISSNYDLGALGSMYNPQIMSRLEGEYEIFSFFGRDIRKQKKEL